MPHSIEISCEHVWREMSNYLDNEIEAALRARMEAHFKACAHCAAVLDGARNVVAIVGDGRAFDIPKGFSQRLRDRIAKQLSASQVPPKKS
jgi:anti-sigma factor RsiW